MMTKHDFGGSLRFNLSMEITDGGVGTRKRKEGVIAHLPADDARLKIDGLFGVL